ncbi:hypothetical protein JK628_20405 [Shewanella sp. KX20019]|uniref:hypothetical protein n=1 Tax=Shewanella sp. KX20019 TaxID=2803864 RepID=UPI0019283ABE|nr:hypothetical protein [Shewanella sp. KX20019]QQX79839.1 hypothetical protein JK628_20405 [Shewanella sp. KX20019]
MSNKKIIICLGFFLVLMLFSLACSEIKSKKLNELNGRYVRTEIVAKLDAESHVTLKLFWVINNGRHFGIIKDTGQPDGPVMFKFKGEFAYVFWSDSYIFNIDDLNGQQVSGLNYSALPFIRNVLFGVLGDKAGKTFRAEVFKNNNLLCLKETNSNITRCLSYW